MADKAKILLVEDDPTLSYVVRDSLSNNGYDVVHCADAETAWAQFMKHNFDVCLLDVMLPKKDGMHLATQIRQKNEAIPILLLTSKNMDDDKIAGFKSGADDYITKPFNMQELLLRLEVFLKRTRKKEEDVQPEVKLGNLTFDYNNLVLEGDGVSHQLTQREADLIKYFCANANKVLKRDEILLNVWGKEDYFLGRSMDVFITKVRKYLKGQPGVELQTIHGIGFKFVYNPQ
ncbi:MAG: two-component system response regulator [Bacteroidetes bacterium 43-93]|jgi:DNA-binding response OmpR family regulator|nr:response regulator transcription factor [Bacteroidota bacterium]MBS1778917.1 response regulator transcription factor [Bacteroidota bacterium]OJW97816.1 MAG: two-component system response regulator [Bacteroidetes bacterium 43-93]